jgi:hypothetical protein
VGFQGANKQGNILYLPFWKWLHFLVLVISFVKEDELEVLLG